MLAKRYKLPLRSFRIRHEKRRRGRFFSVVKELGATPHVRVGVVVSKKVDPHAIGRNRIRRFVFHYITMHSVFRAIPPWDICVTALPGARNAKPQELQDDLGALL